ncbi:hypothetical protein LS70_009375 [Helicobacter sp. MIT 11-5569]|uniref:hypothetical protein n=1 Tax=Helicobacter sp. MIT 11-5569 TaxID=1548151 RepID=UPI00051FEA26|nr:hypothetical protein [Helicobacter sp. MIT 11-5569]TLD80042.1 hypothetical protein LS70_009375 [Helicobacter sp. MIT 11-5569]
MFEDLVDRGDLYGVLPLTLYVNKADVGKITHKGNFELSSVSAVDSIPIIFTTYQLNSGEGYLDIKEEILDFDSKYII